MMTEKHYLLKVLGLSGIPKLITFGLTLLSFPLLIRALGATEYGSVLLIGAALGIFEVLIEPGVTAAAGMAMARIRAHRPQVIRDEFYTWVRLQVSFVVLGYAPMLLAAMFMLESNTTLQFKPELLYVLSAAAVSQIVLNLIRTNLQSLLAFKSLAVLDTFESVLRSGSFLVVAVLFPTAMGLALAGLITSVVVASLAVELIRRRLSNSDIGDVGPCSDIDAEPAPVVVRTRLRDSLNFLWLKLSTRLFQQGPLLLIGRLFGPEVVGILGAFSRISEIISTPYLVIGNALMVRVNEISRKGQNALQALWDTALRIMSTALLFAALIFLAAEPLAHALLPASPQAPKLFGILALVVVAISTFSLIAPMSDYMGGLASRNSLLTGMAILQIPILWVSAQLFGTQGAVLAYVLIFIVLAAGYVLIASKAFFNKYSIHLRRELIILFGLVVFALIAVTQLELPISIQRFVLAGKQSCVYAQIGLFLSFVMGGVALNKKTRAFYFNANFFEFSSEAK